MPGFLLSNVHSLLHKWLHIIPVNNNLAVIQQDREGRGEEELHCMSNNITQN